MVRIYAQLFLWWRQVKAGAYSVKQAFDRLIEIANAYLDRKKPETKPDEPEVEPERDRFIKRIINRKRR